MARFARVVVVLAALYMAVALVWTEARNPFMGVDYTLYGDADRPARLIGAQWSSAEMEKWAATYNVDVLVSGSAQHSGVIAGFPAKTDSEFSRWLAYGHPCLQKPCVAKPRNLAHEPQLIAGFEVGVTNLSFMGDNSFAAAMAAQEYYAGLGWQTGIQDMNSPQYWVDTFRVLFAQVTAVVAILVFLLTAGHALSRSKSSGVQLLQGSPRWQILLSDGITWTIGVWVGAAASLGLTFVVAWATVGVHFFSYVTWAFLAIVTGLWMAGLLGYVTAHQILRSTGILQAVKGRVRFGAAFPIMYLLRCVVVVLCGLLLLHLNQTRSDLATSTRVRAQLGPLSSFSSFGVNTGARDNQAVRDATAREMTPVYQSDKIVVTRGKPEFFYDTSHTMDLRIKAGGDRMVLEVNSVYLSVWPTTLGNGRRLDPGVDLDDSHVTLIFPAGTPDNVKQDIRTYVKTTMFDGGRLGTVTGWNNNKVPYDELTSARGETQYASVSSVMTAVPDPVMIVLPKKLSLGTDFVYTSEGILVKTSQVPDILKSAPTLRKGITGFETTSSGLDVVIGLLKADLARELFELTAYLILLPMTTVAAILMYTRQNVRRIFAQTISGRPLLEVAPLIIILDVISLCAVGWFVRPQAATLELLNAFGSNAGQTPIRNFVIVLTILMSLFLAEYVIFVRAQRTIVLERGSEA